MDFFFVYIEFLQSIYSKINSSPILPPHQIQLTAEVPFAQIMKRKRKQKNTDKQQISFFMTKTFPFLLGK